jgi:hypothetical protein
MDRIARSVAKLFPERFHTARRRHHSAERYAETQMARKTRQHLTEERSAEERSKAMKRKPKATPVAKSPWPVRREQLLAQAKATQSFEPVAQRNAVNKLILESVWSGVCTSVEILEAAYGDPQGHRYWELWLFEPLPIYQFAELLALDSAATNGAPVLDRYLLQIFERLRAAAEEGKPWFIGDTAPLISEPWCSLTLRNSAVAVRPREAIAWMRRNPNARHLVPTIPGEMVESLAERAILAPASPASAETPNPSESLTIPTATPAGMDPLRRTRRGPQRGTVDRKLEDREQHFAELLAVCERAEQKVFGPEVLH